MVAVLAVALTGGQALAQQRNAAKPNDASKVHELEKAGRWTAYATQGSGPQRTCYALGKARERKPANLKDVEGLMFVTTRPAASIRNEIAFVMNFDLKEDIEHFAVIGEQRYALVAKGQRMWLRNPAEEGRMLDAMRRANEMEIRSTSKRGNPASDSYALQGLAQIVKKAEDSCK
jgi:hypothetical protein